MQKFDSRGPLAGVLGAFKREFLWVGVFSMIANVLMLTPTLYMLQVFDRVLLSRSEITLVVLTLVMVLFYAVMAFAEWLRSRLLVRSGVRLDQALNSLVFHAGFEQFLKNAKLQVSETFSDLTNLRQFMTGNGIIALFDLPWTPVYIVVLFLLHPYLGLLSLVFAAIQVGIALWNHCVTGTSIERAADSDAASTNYLQGKIRNIEPVHSMGMARHLRRRWQNLHEQALDASSRVVALQGRQQSVAKFARYTMQSFTLGAGALLVIYGDLTVGAMIAGNMLMSRALAPLDMIVSVWKQFVQAWMGYTRLDSLIGSYEARDGGVTADEVRGEVKVQDLVATAADGRVMILQGLTTSFRPGELVVMAGPSGSGKSTFARALVGVWPETKGEVLIDDTPVDKWDRSVLGPGIGYLPQDVELFDGTFAENIARFADVEPGKVIEAATKTAIHDMILRFPKGYDTRIGDGGRMLSGGQRQRVALARALYGNPSFVVLDEPNANLDDVGERALQQAVRDLIRAGTTVLLISHRPGIVAIADRLLVMSKGHIEHDGPRDEVLAALRTRTASAPQYQESEV